MNKTVFIGIALTMVMGCAALPGKKTASPKQAVTVSPFENLEEEMTEQYEIGGIKPSGFQVVPILVYHDFRPVSRSPLQVTPEAFDAQMRYLKENGYRVISLDVFFQFLDLKIGLPEKSVVITIDDGWKSGYTIAYPIMRKYGFTATLFIYTDFISRHNPGALTWDMMKEMQENGFDFQSHTKTHQLRIPWQKKGEANEAFQKRITEELRIPKQTIEAHLSNHTLHIAYPYGQYNDGFVLAAQKNGYLGGLSVKGAKVKEGVLVRETANPVFVNPFEVRRVQILAGMPLNQFKNKLKTFQNEDIYDGRYNHLFHPPKHQ